MTGPGDSGYQRLRIEWQRFKSHVIDPSTELPTLAAVLDDVRRLMEERGTLGLVYFDLSGYGRAEARYGTDTYDRLVDAFAQALVSLRADGWEKARAGLLLHAGERSEWIAEGVLAAPWWRVV